MVIPMMGGNTPVLVLKEDTQRDVGSEARKKLFAAAQAISEAVRTTLGPKGMDKMLVDSMGDIVITNDGVTLLKEMDVVNPAAKMVVEVAKTQDEECGDGTTTAVIITGELLKRAEELLDNKVHPTIIAQGYRMAATKAVEILNGISQDVGTDDTTVLKQISTTAMTGKSAEAYNDILSTIAVNAVKAVAEQTDGNWYADLKNIQIEKKTGASVAQTELITGLVLDKERVHSGMPGKITEAKIALVDSAFEIKKTEVDAKYNISDPSQFQAFLQHEEGILRKKVEAITASGANVLICQKGIEDIAQHFLSKAGIYAIRRAKKSDMEKLARATGARIVTNLDELTATDLGTATTVEERKIGDDELTFVTGCSNPKAVSILVRGGTDHVTSEIERALVDALNVVKLTIEDGKVTIGGGSAAIEISQGLREYAKSVAGREQLAIEAYATAIEIIPRTLAENGGHDPIKTILELRSAHQQGNTFTGIDVFTGMPTDMKAINIIEPVRVNVQAIQSATESATMILRIDDIIAAKKGAPMPPGGGMGGMPPGMM